MKNLIIYNDMTPKKIPKVKPDSWLFGNMKSFSKDPDRFLKKCAETYGDIFQFRIAHKRFIAINHPDYIQHVLQTNHRNYKQFSLVKLIIKVIGDGLFALEGEQWKKERRLMQPYFHKEMVRSYFTAPKVRPRTSCFWLNQPTIRIGAMAMVEAAESLA